jgi:predicted helicase
LIPDLDADTFSDLYAQTLVYGLFIARFFDPVFETFDRREARDLIPKSNPLLRTFFDHIAGASFETRLAYVVDELCDVFRVTDVEAIVRSHISESRKSADQDPIIHFYEDFLGAYDPDVRKRLGAYYTPVEVVRFILNNVNSLLVEKLAIPSGLADDTFLDLDPDLFEPTHRVQVLDPATGTGTFLNELVGLVRKQFRGKEGLWAPYVNESLLPRITGFEILMAPYTVAHLKLGVSLRLLAGSECSLLIPSNRHKVQMQPFSILGSRGRSTKSESLQIMSKTTCPF